MANLHMSIFIDLFISTLSLNFLSIPAFLTLVSSALHSILLLGLLISWLRHKFKKGIPNLDHSKDFRARVSYYRTTRLICVLLAVYNFGLCVFDYFFWHQNDWSDDLSLVVRSSVWLALFVYLHTQLANSGLSNIPILLRVWWGLYFTISCYCLSLDLLDWFHSRAQFQSLVSGFVYVITGFIFCYVGVFAKIEQESISLQEKLLNDKPKRERKSASLYTNAGFLSILSFSWMRPLISTGYNKALDSEDVPQLDTSDSVNEFFPIFKTNLDYVCGADNIQRLTSFRLFKSIVYTTWVEIVITGFLALVHTLATYVGPYLIDDFVQYMNGRRRYDHEGYMLVSGFLAAKLVECFAQRHWDFRLRRVAMWLRAGLITEIYNKGLTISGHSKQGHTNGEMINFMAVDAERISKFCWYIQDPWIAVLQVTLALLILYRNLGLASVATVVAIISVMVINYPFSNRLDEFQEKLMGSKDNRMKVTSEVLQNMRILKLQAWEMKFLSKIYRLRESEAEWLKKFLYTTVGTSFLFRSAPAFVSVVTFVACLLMGIPLEAGKVLCALATFQMLSDPIYALPDTLSILSQCKVSLDRIVSFLRLDDMNPNAVERLPRAASEVAIEITEGAFRWDSSTTDPTLKHINVKIHHGVRVAICGVVGSGKSSLLSCILGEMSKLSGTIKVSGSKAYVAQSAWIQSGTIVDNILFGSEMDQERYETILEACSLKRDLQVLAFGDQTIIGERGINLSGGQKQRIQIARALYQDADIYLFDDPFSAVDAHTGTHLFKECLLGFLKSKTVVFVTHQVDFLPAADLILVMKDGRISQAGKYDDILASGSDLMELVGAHDKALTALDSIHATKPDQDTKAEHVQEDDPDTSQPEDTKAQLVQEEERAKGKVGFKLYYKYITTAFGGALVPLILLAHLSFQILEVGSNYWMASATPASPDAQLAIKTTTLIKVFAAFAFGSALCILLQQTLVSTVGYKTATILFNRMHSCIFRAPMAFFDATPSGRILNRASADQSDVDMSIPFQIENVASTIIHLLAIVAIMSQVAWQVVVIFIPITCICFYYQKHYLPTARELTRLAGVCKAPIMQHFAETVAGATTIRGFDKQSRFQDRCVELIDGFSRPKFYLSGAEEWLCFRLELLSVLTFACSLIFLISFPAGFIDVGIAGLAVTYGLSLNRLQTLVTWYICQLENKIIAVERILQYTDIPSEPPLLVEVTKPNHSWPWHGEVDIRDLQVRYAPHLPLVLRGITCTFHGGRKNGIVGRTGSGKSTLILALFRIVDPVSGSIVIDGLDISMIGLHDLRSRLSIIPQDPVMFEGTIRNNLDPLEEFTDAQIWDALDKCQLGDQVRSKEDKLDSIVAENGENWSMGQRQLVCLGRVLLKKSRILVLDEATASVDTATDNLIQQTLTQHFSESTLLVIAHRITSVLDSEMVLVLSQGVVEECDSPTRLLEDESSSFAQLVAEYSSRSKSSRH